jgi:hypothetical protein
MIQELNKLSQLQIGKDMRVELQIPPNHKVDLTTPRRWRKAKSKGGNQKSEKRPKSRDLGFFISKFFWGYLKFKK